MTPPTRSPLDIYKRLPQTNCGQCFLPSCLAFAAAVAAGRKTIRECPWLKASERAELPPADQQPRPLDVGQAEFMAKLKAKMATADLAHIAPHIGGAMSGDRIIINSLGKDFIIDRLGNISSECHNIPWVQAPLLAYITNESHSDITGRWISFREINGGIEWQGLFTSRCEMPLRQLADDNQGLLGDLIDLFRGEAVDWYQADIALILHPLPKIPILICYQAPEDDLESALTIFFDECCPENLHIKSIFTLCAGLVLMFSKIADRHR